MKKIFLFFAFLPFFSFAQEFSEVVEMPGKTAGQLYSTAREWFAKSFISADNTLLMDDLISGKIIAKGSIPISEGQATRVSYANFTIKVAFKDGRYKSEITDISITSDISELSSGTTTPFKEYFDKKETYKKLGDPEWVYNNPPGGIKIGKAAARARAQPNQDIYNLICKIESEMMAFLSKLNQEMKKSEVAW
jgi:hypothetical protein